MGQWSPADPQYSWIAYASSQGYPTLAIDRLGNGNSSHPDPILVVQCPAQAATISALVGLARGGASPFPRKFETFIFVGSSLGTLILFFDFSCTDLISRITRRECGQRSLPGRFRRHNSYRLLQVLGQRAPWLHHYRWSAPRVPRLTQNPRFLSCRLPRTNLATRRRIPPILRPKSVLQPLRHPLGLRDSRYDFCRRRRVRWSRYHNRTGIYRRCAGDDWGAGCGLLRDIGGARCWTWRLRCKWDIGGDGDVVSQRAELYVFCDR